MFLLTHDPLTTILYGIGIAFVYGVFMGLTRQVSPRDIPSPRTVIVEKPRVGGGGGESILKLRDFSRAPKSLEGISRDL